MYIQLRGRLWYACHEIPLELRPVVGRVRYVQGLKTADKDTALRRAAALEARWRAQLDCAKAQIGKGGLVNDAEFWAGLHKSADATEKPAIEALIYEEADILAKQKALAHGIHDTGDAFDRLTADDTKKFVAIATRKIVRTDENLAEYISTLKNEPKSITMKRSTIKGFADQFIFTSDVSKKAVQQWVNKMVQDGKALATVRRAVSELRGYWKYLAAIDVVSEEPDPFSKLVFPTGKSASGLVRNAFSAEQISELYREAVASGDTVLADLIDLGRWTGCRIEELCSLPVERAKDGILRIEDAKTQAGWRSVPVHSKLAPTVARLVRDSQDGYLLSGLAVNKNGDRSAAMSKRFGRLKKSLGHGDDLVFHSIRHSVATFLENAGIPENVSADLLGHKKTTMTYGLYSGGCSLEVMKAAIERLDYP